MIKTTKTILICAGLVLCMGLTAFAATSETQEEATVVEILTEDTISPEDVGVRIAKKYIHLRSEPSNESEVIATIPRGDQVVVLGRENGFVKVSYKDLQGYIGDKMLTTEDGYQEFMDSIPYYEEIPLDRNVQQYLWLESYDTGVDYPFALAIIDIETGGTFNPGLTSYANAVGIMQVHWPSWGKQFIKMGYVTCKEDAYNIYNGIHMGMYLLSQYVAQFGCSEAAAYKYNTGKGNANSSNAYSRKTMKNYEKWKAIVEQ